MSMPKRLSLLLLSISLFFTSACSDEAQLAEQCETQSSCETTTETKTNWASAGGIGAGVLALGALAGSAGGSANSGSSSSSGTTSTPSTGSAARSCTLNGETINHGDGVKGFANASVPYGSRCQSEDRMCEDGTLSGSFTNSTCSIEPFSTVIMKPTTEICESICDGLVVHLPFDGNADNTANGEVSARISGATFVADKSGNPNSALSFDGNDYVLLEGLKNLGMENRNFTISYVAKIPSDKILNSKLFSIWGIDNSINKDSNSLEVKFEPHGDFMVSSRSNFGNETDFYSADDYFHSVVTFNQSEGLIKQYFNGELQGIGRVSGIKNRDNDYLSIGLNYNQEFHGTIDDFRIYNRELSGNEVRNLVGIPEKKVSDESEFRNPIVLKETTQNCDDVCDGLSLYYSFSQDANDTSGNGLHGMFYGAEFTEDRKQNPNYAASFNGENFIYTEGLDNILFDDAITIIFAMAFDEKKITPSEFSWGDRIFVLDSDSSLNPIGIHLYSGGSEMPHIAFWGDNFNHVYNFRHSQLREYFHFVGVVSKSDGLSKIYINGDLKSLTPFFGDIQVGSMFIGGGRGSIGLNGVIDELRIYNRALSESEIQQIVGIE